MDENEKVRIVGTKGRPIFVDPRDGVIIGQRHWFGYGRYRGDDYWTPLIVEAGEGGVPLMAREYGEETGGDASADLFDLILGLIDEARDSDQGGGAGKPPPTWAGTPWDTAPGLPPGY